MELPPFTPYVVLGWFPPGSAPRLLVQCGGCGGQCYWVVLFGSLELTRFCTFGMN